jgi:hypothetical protein
MRKIWRRMPLILVSLCGMTLCARGDTISTLFSTGVDASGSVLTHTTDRDPHYIVTPGYNPLVDLSPASHGWDANTASSEWIRPDFFTGSTQSFKTTFDLTGLNPASASITAQLWADDGATVFLNGTPVFTGSFPGYLHPDSLTLTSGFVSGVNTLMFVVPNADAAQGLQFKVTSATANPIGGAAPLPSSAWGGLALLTGWGMRRLVRRSALVPRS